LFPTEVRAQASAWIRKGFGNAGSIVGPAIVGVVGATNGLLGNIGAAVSVLTLVYLLAPEKGRLELTIRFGPDFGGPLA
jgi:hypothetical protein